MARRRVVFLTKPGCGLCDDALVSMHRVARWFRCEIEIVDIKSDPDLEASYHLRIPVVLDRHGTVLTEGVIGVKEALGAVLRTYR